MNHQMPSGADAGARAALGARIRAAAMNALSDPRTESDARMQILANMLHPSAAVVDRAIAMFERGGEPFPTTEREHIASYIERVIERRVLGTATEREPIDLGVLVASSGPFAWSDRFALACVQAGVKEVTRQRSQGAPLEAAEFSAASMPSREDQTMSAEDYYLLHERRALVEQIEVAYTEFAEQQAGRFERTRAKAAAMRKLMNLPAPAVSGITHKRWLLAQLNDPDAVATLRASLEAHRDMASGDPKWEQLAVDDRLLDLWMDYTAEQAHTLLIARDAMVRLIVTDAAMLPPTPSRTRRFDMRRTLKAAGNGRGWSSLVMRLEAAWVAEHFDARGNPEHSSRDTRTLEEAETQRAAAAEDWPAAVATAIAHPGSPFDPGHDDETTVAAWLMRVYELQAAPLQLQLPEALAA